MSLATFSALLVFAFVSSITPGPNNIMLLASGVNFGLKRTVPHLLGICFGFGVLLASIGFGLGVILAQSEVLFNALKIAGGLYMVYLAWRIARTTELSSADSEKTARPMRFYEAALFQWVNAKAWVMAVTAMSVYTVGESDYAVKVAIVALVFCGTNLPCVTIWAGLGVGLRRFLQDPKKLRIFNWGMALALLASHSPSKAVKE